MNRSAKIMTVANEQKVAAKIVPLKLMSFFEEIDVLTWRISRFVAAQPVILSRMKTPAA